MNTKLVLMMLMITSVILIFEAETVISTGTPCRTPKHCAEPCKAKGCKHGKCMNGKCRCMLCSK
uniref:AKTx n=1 Tax=Hadrurus spadix TaxID=141984 RepID=A0A1W7RB43_9SCOR